MRCVFGLLSCMKQCELGGNFSCIKGKSVLSRMSQYNGAVIKYTRQSLLSCWSLPTRAPWQDVLHGVLGEAFLLLSCSTYVYVIQFFLQRTVAGKFGGELTLAVWWIDQPTTKSKYVYKVIPIHCAHKGIVKKIGGCGLWALVQNMLLAQITATVYRSFKASFWFLFQCRIITHWWLLFGVQIFLKLELCRAHMHLVRALHNL